MRGLWLAASLPLLGIAPAQAEPASEPSWQESVRCLAVMERMPEFLPALARYTRALKPASEDTPALRTSLAKSVEETGGRMREGVATMHANVRVDARQAHRGDDAAADLAFERLLKTERASASRFVFDAVSKDPLKAQVDAFVDEYERVC